MGLDVNFYKKRWFSYDEGETLHRDDELIDELYITHNLNEMAIALGVYEIIWKPDEVFPNQDIKPSMVVDKLEEAYQDLKNNKNKYSQFNPKNGWGDYEALSYFIDRYINICKKHKDTIYITVWR